MRLYKQKEKMAKSMVGPTNKKSAKTMSKKSLEEKSNILYQDAKHREIKMKKMREQNKNTGIVKSSENSNKYILRKFTKLYRTEVEKMLSSIIDNQESEIKINKLNFSQLTLLLQNINFVSKDLTQGSNEEESSQANNSNLSKNQEKKLLVELYEQLKDSESLINLDHLFIFCLSILNLLEYYVVKSYKKTTNAQLNTHPDQISSSSSQRSLRSATSYNTNSNAGGMKKNSSNFTLQDENIQNLIQKLNLDLTSRIVHNKKYGGLDAENNFIITFNHAKLIVKDYNMFSYNYTQSFYNKKPIKDETLTFKPTINPKSQKLYTDFRRKIVSSNDEVEDQNFPHSHSTNNPHTHAKAVDYDYFNTIQQKKKLKEKINEKIREEKELKELEYCTFKPKINNNYPIRDNIVPLDDNILRTSEYRVEQMYKVGTETLISRKNRTRDDMELDKNAKECTFKPNINEKELNNIFEIKGNNLNNDKDIQKFNERMKRGRIVNYS